MLTVTDQQTEQAEKKEFEKFADSDINAVHKIICHLGATYPSEITQHTGMPYEKIMPILFWMQEHKIINKIFINEQQVHPLIAKRLTYLWGRGIQGFEKISNMFWVSDNADWFENTRPENWSPKYETEELI